KFPVARSWVQPKNFGSIKRFDPIKLLFLTRDWIFSFDLGHDLLQLRDVQIGSWIVQDVDQLVKPAAFFFEECRPPLACTLRPRDIRYDYCKHEQKHHYS